jgi:hypothetical protein
MAGGKGKIHLHPNHNTNGLKQRPQDAGRRPKLINQLLKEAKEQGYENARLSDIQDVLSYLVQLPLPKLKEIAGSPNDASNDYPMLLRVYAIELLSKNRLRAIESLLDRSHGKATNTVKLEGVTQAAMPQDAAAQLAAILERIKDEDPTYSTMPPPEDE